MRKLLLVALAAIFSLSLASGAWANTISAEPGGEITTTSLGKLTFAGGSFRVACNVVLRGSIERSINNAAGASVGSVSSGSTEACEGGSGTPLFSSPTTWELTLNEATRLEGSPASVIINVRNAQFSVTVAGVTCLYKGTVPVLLEASGSPLRTGLMIVQANSVAKNSGSIFCPSSGSLSGTFSLSPQQTLTLS